jgi:hypothetical protein
MPGLATPYPGRTRRTRYDPPMITNARLATALVPGGAQ